MVMEVETIEEAEDWESWEALDSIEDDGLVHDIDSANTIHDRLQFQCRYDYDLHRFGAENSKDLSLDLYFFLPRSMGINSNSYERKQFFSDLTNYLRIKTPFHPDWYSSDPLQFRLHYSELYLDSSTPTSRRKNLVKAVEKEVKLFGCFLNTLLKDLKLKIKSGKQYSINPETLTIEVIRDAEDIQNRLTHFRNRYLSRILSHGSLYHEKVRKCFHLVNEYLSYRLEDNFIYILEKIEKEFKLHSKRVKSLLNNEINYRKRHLYGVRASFKRTLAESLHYRLGLLKKYVSSVLYLKSKSIKKDSKIRNIIAATGAALAASFAAMTEAQRYQMMQGPQASFRLGIVFIVGVVGYVLKDRIKDLSKEYFNNKLRKFLPDRDFELKLPYVSEDDTVKEYRIGICQEYMTYLKKESLPAEIQYLRQLDRRDELEPERHEEVIQYSKGIQVNLDNRPNSIAHVNQIKDIIRFDVSEMLKKLSEPTKTWKYFSDEGSVESTNAPRVYHINVIARYKLKLGHEHFDRLKIEYERFRLVLDKTGILRLESVVPRGELALSEEVPK